MRYAHCSINLRLAHSLSLYRLLRLQIFTSTPPWGVLPDNRIYQLVVREDCRPDRPDEELEESVGLTDQIWAIIDHAWDKESRLRPSFEQIVTMWQYPVSGEYSRITPFCVEGELTSTLPDILF